jgi:hypothetical protein
MRVAVAFVLVLAVFLGGIAYAQSRGGGQRPPGPHPVLAAFDADRDGMLGGTEIDGASDVLRKLDSDRDGQVSEEELIRGMPGPGPSPQGGQQPPRRKDPFVEKFMEQDSDKDGAVDRKEFQVWTDRLFAFADADKDGLITPDEARKLGEILRPRR